MYSELSKRWIRINFLRYDDDDDDDDDDEDGDIKEVWTSL